MLYERYAVRKICSTKLLYISFISLLGYIRSLVIERSNSVSQPTNLINVGELKSYLFVQKLYTKKIYFGKTESRTKKFLKTKS